MIKYTKKSNVFEYIYSKITIFKYFNSYNLINGKQKNERSQNEF